MCKILIVDNDIQTPPHIKEDDLVNFLQNHLPSIVNSDVEVDSMTGHTIDWDVIKSDLYDIYIVDYYINGITGCDLVEEIRNININVPILVYSKELNLDTSLKLIRSGASDYLNKTNIDLLPHIIGRQLDTYSKIKSQLTLYRQMNKLLVHFTKTLNWIFRHSYSEISFYKILKKFGKILNVDRVYLYEKTNNETYTLINQWTRPNNEEQRLDMINRHINPRLIDSLRENNQYILSRNLCETEKEARFLQYLKTESIVVVPIFGVDDGVEGFVGFDDQKSQRNWSAIEINVLITISSILGAIYAKKKQEDHESKLFQKGIDDLQSFQTVLNYQITKTSRLIEGMN